MFKMLLLEQWFNLSDNEVEMQSRMRIDFLCFLGLSLIDPVPDATALVRFRQRLLADQVGKMLFDQVIDQLAARNMIVRKGTLIDATIVESARTAPPRGGSGSSDMDAGWAVKRGTATHGYKAHTAVDAESDIVRCIATTPGNVHDSTVADGIAPRILYKGRRNAPLTRYRISINKRWSAVRSQVERVFADWKVRRSLKRCRYVGLEKNHLHFTLMAMAHNLRRMMVMTKSSPQLTA
jgi:IS5 family transposase